MLRLTVLVCTLATLTVAYGSGYGVGYYGGYGSYSSEEDNSRCKKLGHFDVDSANEAHLVRKAKFTDLIKDGKHYTMISCPNDAHQYALIAEDSGSVFGIFGSTYSNTAVLAAGFKVGVVAKCDGKRTIIETTDGKKIKIKKVTCIQTDLNSPGLVTTTLPDDEPTSPCLSCNHLNLLPTTDTGITYKFSEPVQSGDCFKVTLTCAKSPELPCGKVQMLITGNGEDGFVSGEEGTDTVSADFVCEGDGLFSFGSDLPALTGFYCFGSICEGNPPQK